MTDDPKAMTPDQVADQLRIRASRNCADGYVEFDAELDRRAAAILESHKRVAKATADVMQAQLNRIAELEAALGAMLEVFGGHQEGEVPAEDQARAALRNLLAEVMMSEAGLAATTPLAREHAQLAAEGRATRAEAALRDVREALLGLRPHVPLSHAMPVESVTSSVPSLEAAWRAADAALASIDALGLEAAR